MCASCYELKKTNDELRGYNASLQRQADEGANAKMKLKIAMERIEYLDRQLAISEELRLSGDDVIDQLQLSISGKTQLDAVAVTANRCAEIALDNSRRWQRGDAHAVDAGADTAAQILREFISG